jgi:hypothetical protein
MSALYKTCRQTLSLALLSGQRASRVKILLDTALAL